MPVSIRVRCRFRCCYECHSLIHGGPLVFNDSVHSRDVPSLKAVYLGEMWMEPPSCRPGRACQCPISFRCDVPCTTKLLHISMEWTAGTVVGCFSCFSGAFHFRRVVCVTMKQENGSSVDVPVHQTARSSSWRVGILSGLLCGTCTFPLPLVSLPNGRITGTRTFMGGRRGEPASMECRHSMSRRGISRPYPPRRGPVGRASSSAIPAEEPQIHSQQRPQSSASHASPFVDYPRISTHCRRGFPQHPLLSLVFRPHSSAGNTSVSIPTAPIAGCHGLSMWKLLRHFLRSTACTRSVVPSQRWNSASIVASVGAGRVHSVVAVERSVLCHKQQSLRKQTRHWTGRVSPESGTTDTNSRRLVAEHLSNRKQKY